MDERRAKALDALSTYIQNQRALLAQTESDIEQLKEIRGRVAVEPSDLDVPQYLAEIRRGPTKLSEQSDITATLPDDFDWSLLASLASDSSAFKNLAASYKQDIEKRVTHSDHHASSSSALLEFVRNRRRAIIDPVLASMPPLSSDEEDEPMDPEELRKLHEREKIRELKQRKINGGGGLAILGIRKPRASDGVFIRTDVEDESAEVDVFGADQQGDQKPPPSYARKSTNIASLDTALALNIDTPPTSVASPASSKSPLVDPGPSSTRQRRSSRKVTTTLTSPKLPSGKLKLILKVPKPDPVSSDPMDVEPDEDQAPLSNDPPLDKKCKPRPETYKQAWSVSEQHLLERLLEEIPDGEKNRWAKISKAMNGRRTARQVASRVQKYYEKLKRFGLHAGAS
ncbi:hypothetical protein EIP91_009383 [Steccherinum ochraceum]|uniref:Uncharacterized protein n=1 Tax=Steccherinum ochraceum TaxID=92696 RepID=A0A4V6N708_9APHY|nr:hypothetical protein EIP91_009383 [Steccherinum ochraceum]